MSAVRWTGVVLVVLVAACAPDLKPHQLLAKGEAMLHAGDTVNAEKTLRSALDKAIRAEIDWVRLKTYALPLFQLYALGGNLKAAEPLFDRVERPQDELYLFPHAAHNLAVLYARTGRTDDARRVMAKTIDSIHKTSSLSNGDRRHGRVAILANFDRLATAAGDTAMAAQSFAGAVNLLTDLSRFQMSQYWPLAPGLKAFLGRYVAFLKAQGRSADADQIDAVVRTMEGHARSSDAPVRCIVYVDPAPAGCLLEAATT